MKRIVPVVILMIFLVCILCYFNYNNEIINFDISSSQTYKIPVSSAAESPVLFEPKLMDITKPHVFSEMLIAADSPKLNTIDDTLPFPVYHDKHGSYFFAKRTGLYIPETTSGWQYQYVGLEFEDNIVRYFPCEMVIDGFFLFNLYDNKPREEQYFEKVYFKGCLTDDEIITTCYEIISTTEGGNPNEVYYPGNKTGFIEIENSKNLFLKTEEEILDYLLTLDKYNNCQLIITSFGKKALFNAESGKYTFLDDSSWIYPTIFRIFEGDPYIKESKIISNYYHIYYIDISNGDINTTLS